MKKIKFLSILVAFIICPTVTNALEDSSWSVVDEGIEVIAKSKVKDFDISLQKQVEDLNKEKQIEDGKYVTYRYNIDAVIKKYPTNNLICKEVVVDKIFNKEDEAIRYYNDIVVAEDEIKGEYTITPNNEQKEIFAGTTKCVGKCEMEKLTLQKHLRKNQELETTLNSEKQSYENEYKIWGKRVLFDTIEDANKLLLKPFGLISGWTFDGNEVKTTNVEEEKSYKELVGKEIYETEEEAELAKNDFEEKYDNANISINSIKDDNNKICTWITEDTKYQNKCQAEQIVNELKRKRINASVVPVSEPFTDNYSGTFTTREEAEKKIAEYKQKGYTITNDKIEEILKESTKVNGSVITSEKLQLKNNKIDRNSNEDNCHDNNCRTKKVAEFNSDVDYLLIKKGNSTIVWTENELNDAEKNIFIKTYNIVNNVNINNEKFEFIDGFGQKDINSKNWGIYQVEKDLINNKIVLTVCSDSISNVKYGSFETKKTYNYTLTMTVSKNVTYYQVKKQECIIDYDYKISGTAFIDVKKYYIVSKFSKTNYTLEYKILENYMTYNLKYNVCTNEQTELVEVSWNIEKMLSGIGGTEEIIKEEIVLPPKTGSGRISYSLIIILTILGLGLKTKLKNN